MTAILFINADAMLQFFAVFAHFGSIAFALAIAGGLFLASGASR